MKEKASFHYHSWIDNFSRLNQETRMKLVIRSHHQTLKNNQDDPLAITLQRSESTLFEDRSLFLRFSECALKIKIKSKLNRKKSKGSKNGSAFQFHSAALFLLRSICDERVSPVNFSVFRPWVDSCRIISKILCTIGGSAIRSILANKYYWATWTTKQFGHALVFSRHKSEPDHRF